MTVVLQSHRDGLPAWYRPCLDSVKSWARSQGFEYRFLGDELFDWLAPELREKTRHTPVIAADLARLELLTEVLAEDCDRAVWVDADVLVVAPDRLALPSADALFGREVWVQHENRRVRVFRKIHNAFMAFTPADPVLPFYRHAATRIVERHSGPMAPQLIGPKLLTLLHNAIGFEVLETAAMLSPDVARDVLAGGGPALDRFREASTVTPAAINLCGSLVRDGLRDEAAMQDLVEVLVARPELIRVAR